MGMREELMNLLHKATEYSYQECFLRDGCKDCPHPAGHGCGTAFKVDYLLDHGVTLQRWIPVTERLPEPGVDVLCWYEYFRYGDYNRMYQTYGIGCYYSDGFWSGGVSNTPRAKVLAWMPLPAPPKGE